jgi:hypothetical protein
MSIANKMVCTWRNSPNKAQYIARVVASCSFENFGEDTLYHCPDNSVIVHRTLVNELQLFKGVL